MKRPLALAFLFFVLMTSTAMAETWTVTCRDMMIVFHKEAKTCDLHLRHGDPGTGFPLVGRGTVEVVNADDLQCSLPGGSAKIGVNRKGKNVFLYQGGHAEYICKGVDIQVN